MKHCAQAFIIHFEHVRAWMLVLSLITLNSCFQKFYTPNSQETVNATDIEKAISEGRHFILHYADTNVALKSIELKGDDLLVGQMSLPESWRKALTPRINGANHMSKREMNEIIGQAHIYYLGNKPDLDEQVHLQVNKIWRFDVYGLDKKATTSSTVMSIVGIVVVPLGLIYLLAKIALDNMEFNMPLFW